MFHLYIRPLYFISRGCFHDQIRRWDSSMGCIKCCFIKKIGLTIGSWVFIVGGILIFVNGFIKRSIPNVSGFIPILIIGLFVDILNLKLLQFLQIEDLFYRWFLFLGGLCILTFGIAVYLRASFPSVPNDELMLAITKRTGWGINVTKTIGEGIAFGLAFIGIGGGPIGVGTIIVVLCLGFLIGLFDQLLHKVGLTRSLSEEDSLDEQYNRDSKKSESISNDCV